MWSDYDPLRQNMYQLCPPCTSHNSRPKQESNLVQLDLLKMEIKVTKADPEFATADGSLQVMSTNEDGEVENLLIVGGSSQRLDLYSTFNFD